MKTIVAICIKSFKGELQQMMLWTVITLSCRKCRKGLTVESEVQPCGLEWAHSSEQNVRLVPRTIVWMFAVEPIRLVVAVVVLVMFGGQLGDDDESRGFDPFFFFVFLSPTFSRLWPCAC